MPKKQANLGTGTSRTRKSQVIVFKQGIFSMQAFVHHWGKNLLLIT